MLPTYSRKGQLPRKSINVGSWTQEELPGPFTVAMHRKTAVIFSTDFRKIEMFAMKVNGI